MLQRKPAARITLEGIGRHPWLQGPAAAAPAPPPPLPPPAEQPKKPRALDKLAAGLGSMRVSQSSDEDDGAQPGCASTPRSLFKPPSFRREGAAAPRQAPKWPRWMALNQGGDK